ncbi:MAG: DUF2892 domain-containing protein [Epsilonproteobacteria bacterium]|nr:DUF2892 domain-containing protein [Campylobacterota bacterium]
MDVKKISKICRPVRLVVGGGLIGYGIYSGNPLFYLGVVPLIAGVVNFCPLCGVTKQCPIIGKKD